MVLFYVTATSVAQAYWDHVESFLKFSKFKIDFIPVNTIVPIKVDLAKYDCVILHYGTALYNKSPRIKCDLMKQIEKFPRLKVYVAQDEYTNPHYAVKALKRLGVHHIFSCIEDPAVFRVIYPESELPDMTFDTILTGYVDTKFDNIKIHPLENRPLDIIYRGNSLGYVYGSLGAEKFKIGMDINEVSNKYGLKVDIGWGAGVKVFGDEWSDFLQKGRVMLCTESGSSLIHKNDAQKDNLFETMQLSEESRTWAEYLQKSELYKQYLCDDKKFTIAVISPKVFEAIASGTVLVCNEGYYSGVIKPDIHFIPLKHDLSNIEDVIGKIKDISYLYKIQKKAYEDIIKSGAYTYEKFINFFDRRILELFESHNFVRVGAEVSIENKSYIIKSQNIAWYDVLHHPWSFLKYFVSNPLYISRIIPLPIVAKRFIYRMLCKIVTNLKR